MKISINYEGRIESLKHIKAAGFDGVDFCICDWQWYDNFDCKEYHDLIMKRYNAIKELGLKITQTHIPYRGAHQEPVGDGSYKAYEDLMLPLFIRGIELSGEVGGRTAVLHPYFEASREGTQKGNVETIEKLLPICEKNDIILSLENVFGNHSSEAYCSTAEDLLYYIDYFKSPYLGVCLDTGHAKVRDQVPMEMLKKLGKSVTALHINTNYANVDVHSLPHMLSGVDHVDWKDIANTLKQNDYKGAFNLEVAIPGQLNEKAREAFFVMAYEIAKDILE